ncbi:tripartite motif-containing protein 16-like isoform X2 [Hoplias malabaricus]|uniref:tripartite motif-containing protein 16-like isoform X2 n=1 Tax=Hoplias malabaricus TaxID=27720 RepID=UPI00346281FE
MAEASISVDQDQFVCPVCLDLLKDPVTVPCGHSFCKVCINNCWDQEDQTGVYSCPQCRVTFTTRPVLCRNNVIADVVEKLKKTELGAASPAHYYAGPGDVECDFCTGRKHKAVQSCLICVASLCEFHLKPHLEIPALIKHKLIKASSKLQEKICPQHDKLMEIYCRTDQTCICYLCTMHEHRGHDTVAAVAERAERQSELKEGRGESEQRIQEKEKLLQKLKQAVNTLKSSAQTAVEDSERIFTELIRSIEERRSEVTELIRAQEKAELSRAEEHIQQLEQEISDLKRRDTELEQLSHTDDHIQFLQSLQALCVSSGSEDSSNIFIRQSPSFNEVSKSLSELKNQLEQFCEEKLNTVSEQAAAVQILLSEPQTREDFLQHFCRLTLDPNTAQKYLLLSEDNREVSSTKCVQPYSDHPERFEHYYQVLSKESVSGRCYWEVELSSKSYVYIAVSYKEINRKGQGNNVWFGGNDQSWSLECSTSFSLFHNNIKTKISAPSSSRIGVYVDHGAGTLSFYSVSDTMTLLHTVHTTFTQPLYAGILIYYTGPSVKFCDPI